MSLSFVDLLTEVIKGLDAVDIQRAHLMRYLDLVGEGGLEPPRPYGHRNLNPARLPIPPLAHKIVTSRMIKPFAALSAYTVLIESN